MKFQEERELSEKIKIIPLRGEIKLVAGFDCAFSESNAFACAVLLNIETMEIIEKKYISCPVPFPYIPTLLYLREGDIYLKLIERLSSKPHILMVDGHGILHPRKFGLACYVGVKAQIPCIGVAKTKLVGNHRAINLKKGDFEPVFVDGEVRGAVVRTRDNVKPVYVSPGHLIDVKGSLDVVFMTSIYRIPEPIRLAHICAEEMKRVSIMKK